MVYFVPLMSARVGKDFLFDFTHFVGSATALVFVVGVHKQAAVKVAEQGNDEERYIETEQDPHFSILDCAEKDYHLKMNKSPG